MNRDELVAELMKYPNVEVKVTWESITRDILSDNLYMSKDGILLIDGDRNSHKTDFVSGRLTTD